MKKMKPLQTLEDLLAEPGCFSVLFPSFSFLENHGLKVLQLGWGEGVAGGGAKKREAETRNDRETRERWIGGKGK